MCHRLPLMFGLGGPEKKPWAIIDKGNNTILGLKIASSVSDYYKFALTFLMLQVITLVSH